MPEYQCRATNIPTDCDFLRGYLECAEWCGVAMDEDREALELAVAPKWSAAAIKQAREECDDFIVAAASAGIWDATADDKDETELAFAGHDFYLTRNGHGCGFWDDRRGYYGDGGGRALAELAKPYGEVGVQFDDESETLEWDH